jgi:hypothetical protein
MDSGTWRNDLPPPAVDHLRLKPKCRTNGSRRVDEDTERFPHRSSLDQQLDATIISKNRQTFHRGRQCRVDELPHERHLIWLVH